jgi:hypothetical protein
MKSANYLIKGFKKKAIRSFLGLFSLSTMLFVFQACYGTPQDFGSDVLIEGVVKSESDNKTVQGIKVGFKDLPQYTVSDQHGHFSLYCPEQEMYKLILTDEDKTLYGSYSETDTTILLGQGENQIFINLMVKADQ